MIFKSEMRDMNIKDYLAYVLLSDKDGMIEEEERREALKNYERTIINYVKADENVVNIKRIENIHRSLDSVVESTNFSDEILKIFLEKLNFTKNEKQEIKEKCLEEIARYLDNMVLLFKMRELEALYEYEKEKKNQIREYKTNLHNNEQLRMLLENVCKENYVIDYNNNKATVEAKKDNTLNEGLIEQYKKYFNVRKINNAKKRISLSPCGEMALKYYYLSQEKKYTEAELEEKIFSNCMNVVAEINLTEEHNNYVPKMKMSKKHETVLKFAISQTRLKMNVPNLKVISSVIDIDNQPVNYIENNMLVYSTENPSVLDVNNQPANYIDNDTLICSKENFVNRILHVAKNIGR